MRRLPLLAIPLVLFAACAGSVVPSGPAGHTINRDGVLHNTGTPPAACVSCHGTTLQGSGSAPSCTKCHGVEW